MKNTLNSNTQPIKLQPKYIIFNFMMNKSSKCIWLLTIVFAFHLPRFKIHNFGESFLHCFLSLIFLFHKFRKIEYTYLKRISPAANNGWQKRCHNLHLYLFPEPEFPQLLPLLYKSGNVYVTYMYGPVKGIADGCRFFYSRHYHIVKCHTLVFWVVFK